MEFEIVGHNFMSIFVHPHELFFLWHRREEFVGPVKTIHFLFPVAVFLILCETAARSLLFS